MTDLKEFLSLLETTVKASRLSSSKVTSLSQQSKKLDPSTDTEFVSTFLRLNKSLGKKSTNRISSLYVFDAIARANKGVAGREGLLLKMEGVVDSWVNGMCEDGRGGVWTEGRDKTRKIVDIWKKSSTFPAPCLDRLSARLTAASSTAPTPAPPVQTVSPPKPVMSPALPPLEEKDKGASRSGTGEPSTTPPVPPGSLPPEIQKLLGITAQHTNGASKSPLNAPAPTPAGGVDLAAILAGIKKSPNSALPPPGGLPGPTTPAAPPNPLAGIKLDPNQLAALATLAKAQAPPPALPPFPPQGHGSPPYPQGQGYDRYGPGPSRREPDAQRYGFRSPSPPRERYPSRRFDDGPRPRSRSPQRYGRDHAGHEGPGPGPGPGGYDARPEYPERRYDEPSHRRQGSRDGDQHDRAPTYGQVRGRGDRRGRGRGRGGAPGGGREEWESRDRGRFGDREGGPSGQGPPRDSGYPRRPPPGATGSDAGSASGDVQGRGRVALPTEPGKDEFGRDLPTSAEKDEGANDGEEDMALDESDDESKPPATAGPSIRPSVGSTQPQSIPGSSQSQAAYPSQPAMSNPSLPPPPASVAGAPSLETFDRTTFNPADPAAWATLGQAWRASLGRDPNQMELMEWLATGVVGGFGAMMGTMGEGSGGMSAPGFAGPGGPGGGGFQ